MGSVALGKGKGRLRPWAPKMAQKGATMLQTREAPSSSVREPGTLATV